MKKDFLICIILVACSVAFLGFNLGSLNYLKGDENYYFQTGRRMIRDGDWITPRYHRHIRFEKPPLYYWLVAGFFRAFGVNWPVARLTSVLLGSLTILIIYLLALELFGRIEAFFSVLILATNEMFFRYSRLCVSDITFLFFISLALFLFIKSHKTKSEGLFVLSFIPMGLATLTKGPVGAILIILTISIFLINYRGSTLVVKIRSVVLGILLFLAITLPWFIAMASIHKEVFLQHVWSVEIVNKGLLKPKLDKSLMEMAWFYIRSFGYYVPVVLFSFLPWSLFLPFALFRKKSGNKEGYRFILSWFWVVFIVFSIAGFKHTHYMLALSPALAMIVGTYLAAISKKRPAFKKVPIIIGVLSIIIFLSLTGFILPNLDDGALRVFSLKIANEIKKDDQIGMASNQFNIKKLGIHLNNLIFSPYELSGDDLAQYVYIDKRENLVPLLQSKRRVFVLITKADYLEYVPLQLRRRLYILERHMVWKKLKLNEELFQLALLGDLDQLKEEAYLISNQR